MECAESLGVQARFDGELDAQSAIRVDEHVENCAECRALRQDLETLRGGLRQDLAYARTPASLRRRLAEALDREHGRQTIPVAATGSTGAAVRRRSFWKGALSGAGGTALAAGLAFFLLLPNADSPLLDDLVGAHLRSLVPDHLIDVVSTDKHTVKPWFAGRADVSPVVADFTPQGYRLLGGRADYVDRQRAAVVVYQHGPHIINVFSWAADPAALPASVDRNGYHFVFWRVGNLAYCAVSDTGLDELLGLTRLLRGSSAHDDPQKME